MSNFPNNFDDDTTLPFVNDNITEIGGDAINALRDAVFALEQNVGLGAQGTTASIAARFGISFNPDGTLKPSVLTGLGLVTLPVTNDQIADWAQIPERKLALDHKTQDLFNYIRDLSGDINIALGWISATGIKLEPHLIGAIYRHTMDQIDVSNDSSQFLNNNLRALRNNLNSYTLVADINAELLAHQWADGSEFGSGADIVTNNGSLYSNFYAHVGSGIFINTSRFNTVPQTADNVQLFAEFIDQASIFLLGTRIQNLYSAGISRISRSSSLTTDGYGQFIVPPTPAIAYLKDIGNNSSPFDDINAGDDIIQFAPAPGLQAANIFDEQFALVKIGDIIRVNYGTVEVPFIIKEKKYNSVGGNKTYIIRIAGKNLAYQPNAIARIDRPLFNNNKWGELSISPVNNFFAGTPSLIINNPRGAQALGLGFNPAQFDEKHYILYLALYPTGYATDGYTILPGIDVTGNRGTTPGLYTLESIVQATNNAFRAVGYNYRFSAFSYQGEFGICLADSYNNAGFSILSVPLKADGTIDVLANNIAFPNNVVDIQPVVGTVAPDPLGFGPIGSAIASPPFYSVYGSSAASQNPTKIFVPLRRNNYYVNGSESERLAKEDDQALDGYGDGYWVGTIHIRSTPSGRVETTYRVPLDLSTSGLKAGKTIVVQPVPGTTGNLVDYGRFTIKSIALGCCSPSNFTDITVYDAVHARGFSPTTTLDVVGQVALYFGSDSVSFNAESATDLTVLSPFKRHFEVYVNDIGKTFTHERGRMNISGGTMTVNGVPLYGFAQLDKLDIVKISPKLRGYQFGSVTKITLSIFNYNDTTGQFDGYLASYDGTSFTHVGPHISGRKGEITRFYDETGTDYIDVIFDINTIISSFTNQVMDFQLFPTLQLDDEILLLGTCQVNDSLQQVTRIVDARQFGNTSEKDLTNSVFDFMSAPERYMHINGVIRGFDVFNTFGGSLGVIDMAGGIVLVDGKLFNINNKTVSIPFAQELFGFTLFPINWALCINSKGDYETIVLQDYDSITGNVNSLPRVVVLKDPVSAVTYNVPSLVWNDLVNSRRDLTPLYVIRSTITSGSIALVALDARRFVFKKDWGERPTLTAGVDDGEFKNFTSLTTWFNLYGTFSNSVNVKGTFAGASLPSNFTFTTPTKLYGDGVATLTQTSGSLSFTNVSLDNFTINSTGTATSYASAIPVGFSNVVPSILSNSTINFNPTGGGSFVHTGGTAINNCIYNYTGSGGPLDFFGTTLVNDCTFNLNGTSETLYFAGNIKNSVINVNAANCTVIIDAAATAEGCIFNLNGGNTTFSILGNVSACAFNFTNSVAQLPITLSSVVTSSFSFVNNKVVTGGGSVAPTSLLKVLDSSNGTINNNYLFRGSLSLSSGYIAAPSPYTAGLVEVANNFFDSTTSDGSSQNLVSNLPLPWVYRNNLNTPPTVILRTVTSGPYAVVANDHVIVVNASTVSITINLPQVSSIPLGRVLVIKDGNGNFDSFPLILHRGAVGETIENMTADYTYGIPYGSLNLVATSTGWIII